MKKIFFPLLLLFSVVMYGEDQQFTLLEEVKDAYVPKTFSYYDTHSHWFSGSHYFDVFADQYVTFKHWEAESYIKGKPKVKWWHFEAITNWNNNKMNCFSTEKEWDDNISYKVISSYDYNHERLITDSVTLDKGTILEINHSYNFKKYYDGKKRVNFKINGDITSEDNYNSAFENSMEIN